MRRTVVIAAAAFATGLSLSGASAFGYAKLNAWREFGDYFQLGYVVGYLDAVGACKSRDVKRCYLYSGGSKDRYDRWRADLNEYFADPANASKDIPAAMGAIGERYQKEFLQRYQERDADRRRRRAAATPAAPDAGGGRSDSDGVPGPGSPGPGEAP